MGVMEEKKQEDAQVDMVALVPNATSAFESVNHFFDPHGLLMWKWAADSISGTVNV